MFIILVCISDFSMLYLIILSVAPPLALWAIPLFILFTWTTEKFIFETISVIMYIYQVLPLMVLCREQVVFWMFLIPSLVKIKSKVFLLEPNTLVTVDKKLAVHPLIRTLWEESSISNELLKGWLSWKQ